MISKTAIDKENFKKPLIFYKSAREAFEDVLNNYKDATLLIPGYIGFSPNEGSGIYDPIQNSGIKHLFYPINRKLNIVLKQFRLKIKSISGKKVVLLVHYFGYPDSNIEKIVNICKSENAIIIEDSAHALYTDFVDHRCGNYGDFVIYSLHKMLPLKNGGMLKINNQILDVVLQNKKNNRYSPFTYDLYEIAKKRKTNTKLWFDLLKNNKSITIIKEYDNQVTPQTFPIIINNYNRDDLYNKLNELGFGAVSLYHTMIQPINVDNNKNAIWLSKRIINMPVHQDVNKEDIKEMAKILLNIIS